MHCQSYSRISNSFPSYPSQTVSFRGWRDHDERRRDDQPHFPSLAREVWAKSNDTSRKFRYMNGRDLENWRESWKSLPFQEALRAENVRLDSGERGSRWSVRLNVYVRSLKFPQKANEAIPKKREFEIDRVSSAFVGSIKFFGYSLEEFCTVFCVLCYC